MWQKIEWLDESLGRGNLQYTRTNFYHNNNNYYNNQVSLNHVTISKNIIIECLFWPSVLTCMIPIISISKLGA